LDSPALILTLLNGHVQTALAAPFIRWYTLAKSLDVLLEGAAVRGFWILLGLMFGVAGVQAQAGPYLGRIIIDGATVRTHPGDTAEETGTLARGEKIIVDHAEGEQWLAIEAPRGQMSWVRSTFIDDEGKKTNLLPRNAAIACETDVEVAMGRAGTSTPLNIRRTKIPDGTIVKIIGQPVSHNGISWVPIEPLSGDLRYIKRDTVEVIRGSATPTFTVKTPEAPPPASEPGKVLPAAAQNSTPSPAGPSRPAGWPNHPLWVQAEQAEANGDYPRAERLYKQLAADMNQPDGDAELAKLCFTRIHSLRDKQRNGTRVVTAEIGNPDKKTGIETIGPGLFRRTGIRTEGRVTYALSVVQGQVKIYAQAAPGIDLEQYHDSRVELTGTVRYPAELRNIGLMTVTRVQLAKP
jgi:hypothetical protein